LSPPIFFPLICPKHCFSFFFPPQKRFGGCVSTKVKKHFRGEFFLVGCGCLHTPTTNFFVKTPTPFRVFSFFFFGFFLLEGGPNPTPPKKNKNTPKHRFFVGIFFLFWVPSGTFVGIHPRGGWGISWVFFFFFFWLFCLFFCGLLGGVFRCSLFQKSHSLWFKKQTVCRFFFWGFFFELPKTRVRSRFCGLSSGFRQLLPQQFCNFFYFFLEY